MTDIVRLHHEDWDFNRLFGDLKTQGIKSVRLQLAPEWENDDKLRVEKMTELLRASEKAGVNIYEVVPYKPDSSPDKTKFGPEPVVSNGHLKLYLIIGAILAAMVVTWGIVLSQRAFKEQRDKIQSPAAAIPTSVPTPAATPTPVLNRGDLTVRILNGSGKRGAAGELAKFLEGLGYSVSITGNTNLQTGSKLRLKPGSEIYRDILTADLGTKFEAASGSGLPQTDVVGAEIIIGQN
ncbi:MAG: hypothetical protein UV20_C0024G0007 [Candidatus Magasanikbacteria bacterium GW2011_GWA2_42_32]|uniref:LytR/CpsA/Psr regulator C-terminal domain-containing protein n=1 Tax=Candidatus Magasanikbacteria bacterium GW2011_GWA2_42_32 TaxID=1619039 RepID=A0A0G1CAC0_9BACT|nr:MAG: hypothetical protein UV20_C0024G0007 [Candidatus Magasanikbacteria bacterium GW2011_GWA2_42_32]